MIRGNVGANVYFCDAAFARKSSVMEYDDRRSSILVGIKEILEPYFSEKQNIFEEEIAKNLYGIFYEALNKSEFD